MKERREVTEALSFNQKGTLQLVLYKMPLINPHTLHYAVVISRYLLIVEKEKKP